MLISPSFEFDPDKSAKIWKNTALILSRRNNFGATSG